MDTESTQYEDLIESDFLIARTHQERWVLLGLCAIALMIGRAGVVLSHVSGLEGELILNKQQAMTVLHGILAYFLLAFIVHAVADYFRWRKVKILKKREGATRRMAMQDERMARPKPELSPEQLKAEAERRAGFLKNYLEEDKKSENSASKFGEKWAMLRIVFDVCLPV